VKYYVVSDRDLLRLKHTAQVFGDAPNSDTCDELDSAESVCYSRPLPKDTAYVLCGDDTHSALGKVRIK